MELNCYYVVKARTVFHNSETNEIEFRARIKEFNNQNLIEARKEAFNFRNEFICGLLTLGLGLSEYEIGWNHQTKEIEKLSDREIRKLLNPFFEFEDEDKKTVLNKENDVEQIIEWLAPDDSLTWYSKYNNGIWVVLVHNDSELESDNDIVIDKITRYKEPLPTPPSFENLQFEYGLFEKHKFDMQNFGTTSMFFDDEAFLDGEEDENDCLITFEHLETPFSWKGYEKIYWWEENTLGSDIKETSKLPISINEAFNNGESHLVEFKPGLLNWANNDRNIELEIARTLCAFLNSKGGYLFIGIADKDKKVYGVKFPNNSKDQFLRGFTKIKAHYLPPYLAHTINGDFYTIEEKEVFIITVYPSSEPVFIRLKDEQKKLTSKEFFIRSDASTRHLYDIEEIVKYCRKRDNDKKI